MFDSDIPLNTANDNFAVVFIFNMMHCSSSLEYIETVGENYSLDTTSGDKI